MYNDFCPQCGYHYTDHNDNACNFRYDSKNNQWYPLKEDDELIPQE